MIQKCRSAEEVISRIMEEHVVNKSEESFPCRSLVFPTLEKFAWLESNDRDVGGVLTGRPCLIPEDLLGTIGRAGGCIFCQPITL
jgi:hypothetical protein